MIHEEFGKKYCFQCKKQRVCNGFNTICSEVPTYIKLKSCDEFEIMEER